MAARLRHPNIVTVHDIVATAGDQPHRHGAGGGRDAPVAAPGAPGPPRPRGDDRACWRRSPSALDHAHASQVVHRDVKPANIMIEPSGQVKVMDFGIAKLETAANLTSTGLIMGTPNYMSPEQARGLKVDGRSDLFSLGCVLYECLTGARPFQAESVSGILVKILTEDPPPVDFASHRPAARRGRRAEPCDGEGRLRPLRVGGRDDRGPARCSGRRGRPGHTHRACGFAFRRSSRGCPGIGGLGIGRTAPGRAGARPAVAGRRRGLARPRSAALGWLGLGPPTGASRRWRTVPGRRGGRRPPGASRWGARPACSSPSRRTRPSGSRSRRR